MKIRVKFLSLFRDIAARPEDELELAGESVSVGEIVSLLAEKYPGLKEYVDSGDFLVVINGRSASLSDEVRDQAEVVFMPPISGGSNYAFTERIDPLHLLDSLLKSLNEEAGAVAVFIGRVKGKIEEHRVNELSYETLEPLSTSTLARIGEEEARKHGLLGVVIHHKEGTAKPGEPVLFIGVAARGRKEALTALTEILERVKHEAYVWKLEKREDGEYWIIGDSRRVSRSSRTMQ